MSNNFFLMIKIGAEKFKEHIEINLFNYYLCKTSDCMTLHIL